MVNLWYTDKISETQYIEALEFLADRYKDDDTVIAFDLKNEPHGKPNENKAIWNDSEDPNNWKAVAEKAGNAVLDINPNVLILIEGIEIYPKDIENNKDFSSTNSDDYFFNWWGGNLRGVSDYPIDFGTPERNAQIVYSPHDYGPAVFAQPWFDGEYTYESLQEDCWNENWFFIQQETIAPILIGEWGGFMTEPNLTWMTYLRTFIKENRIHHTFWCFNANSGDTGGLVKDDFRTWDEEKYAFVKEVLWQEDGHFVGLDHVIPLGASGQGTSLSYGTDEDATATEPAATTKSSDTDTSSGTTASADTSGSATQSDSSSGVISSEDTGEDKLNVEFLVGILVGVGAVAILVGVMVFINVLRRRSRP
jgi:endoglucanase